MAYEKCSEVSPEIWADFQASDPGEVTKRTGAEYRQGLYYLPFLDRELVIDPVRRHVQVQGDPEGDPGFRVCLTALLYLLKVDVAALGAPISPLELAGGATFFRGRHGLPHTPLEDRFGRDAQGLLRAAARLGGEPRPAGDSACALRVFPGLEVEVILWQADEEFPAQVSFTVPAHLDRCWHLDAVWGLLNLAGEELLRSSLNLL
jgi:hypothetical protein